MTTRAETLQSYVQQHSTSLLKAIAGTPCWIKDNGTWMIASFQDWTNEGHLGALHAITITPSGFVRITHFEHIHFGNEIPKDAD